MSTNPSEFLKTARSILASSTTESDLRAAASRAYYGALHAANDATPDEFSVDEASLSNSASSHKLIIDGLIAWGNSLSPGRTAARIMAKTLRRLKQDRQNADYCLDSEFLRSETEDVIVRAESILADSAKAKNIA